MYDFISFGVSFISTQVDWSHIDTVLLDMDGTLLDLHYDTHFWLSYLPAQYAKYHSVSLQQAQATLQSIMSQTKGHLKWYCIDFWSQALDLDVASIKRDTASKIRARPHTFAFLQFLQSQNKTIILATNAHATSLALKLECVPIAPYFDQIVTSHELGAAKESPMFWSALYERYPFDPARALFIDDTLPVLAAAKDAGIAQVLAIHQPDSQQSRTVTDWPAIHDFNEIMPNG